MNTSEERTTQSWKRCDHSKYGKFRWWPSKNSDISDFGISLL